MKTRSTGEFSKMALYRARERRSSSTTSLNARVRSATSRSNLSAKLRSARSASIRSLMSRQ